MKAILAFLFSNWKEWDYEECIRFFGCKVFDDRVMKANLSAKLTIEANTMIDMAKTEIAPAVSTYVLELANTAAAKKAVDASVSCSYEVGLLKKLARLEDQIAVRADELEAAVMKLQDAGDIEAESYIIRDVILSKMGELRVACDEAETMTAKKYWPFPTYGDLLFGVK